MPEDNFPRKFSPVAGCPHLDSEMWDSTYDTASSFRGLPPFNPFTREARFLALLVAEPPLRPICAIQRFVSPGFVL